MAGTNAIGLSESEIDAVAQDVPKDVSQTQCSICLWAGCECRSGSFMSLDDLGDCKAYAYYD